MRSAAIESVEKSAMNFRRGMSPDDRRTHTCLIAQRLHPVPGTLYPHARHMQRSATVRLVRGHHQYRIPEGVHSRRKQRSRRYAGILRTVEIGYPAALGLEAVAI